MNLQQIVLLFSTALILSSCATTQKIVYFQDEQLEIVQRIEKGSNITMQPKDVISIVISSKDPELATIFNLPRVTQFAGNIQTPTNYNGQIMGYTVNDNGDIDFPTLGKIHIQGLSRQQVSSLIKEKLSESLVKDAVVTVDFINLTYSVMGEVGKPGKYVIDKDQITILEALSTAGDLTIYGKRDKVFLIRITEGNRTTYQLNMTSKDIFSSPAFYIQQNDIIYVEPNDVRANQSTVNGNSARSVSLWMSIASFLTTIGVLIFK